MVFGRLRTYVLRPMYRVGRIFMKHPITLQYPHKTPFIPEYIHPRSRGYHFLDMEKCTGCQQCFRACPNYCIEMVNREEPLKIELDGSPIEYQFSEKNKKKIFPQIWVARCMFCGLCVDACRFDALHHTPHIGEPVPGYDDLMIHPPELMYKMPYYYYDAKQPKKGRKRNVVPFFSDLR
ncbi:MAG: 4Fe-4S binding protein [Candidatus Odinarchaeota archaeon]